MLRPSVDQYDELVTSQSPDRVGIAQRRRQPGRNGNQQTIASQVTECVVDILEVIEIDEQRRAGSAFATVAGAADRCGP